MSPAIVNELVPVDRLTVPSTGSTTITVQNVRGGRPLWVNVAVTVAPLSVYVAEAVGELLETVPEPPAVMV